MRSMQNEKIVLRAAIARLTCLSHGERLSLLKNLDNVSALALLSKVDFCRLLCRDVYEKLPDMAGLVARAERDALIMERYGITMLVPGDGQYPELLSEIPQPPFALYCRGNPDVLAGDCVGVVGTRHPDMNGLKAAFAFSADCVSNGMTVVSGLAFGVDAAAHKGALSVESGKTVAVLGCGIDTIYPAANRRLAAEIIKRSGCIVSEYPPEEPALRWHFPERNRIISGLSCATMVIQAPDKSGALITADFALEQGRDLCVHPVAVSYAENLRAEARRQDAARKGSAKRCGASKRGGVLNLVEEGAPVISSYGELKELVSGRMHQGKLDL